MLLRLASLIAVVLSFLILVTADRNGHASSEFFMVSVMKPKCELSVGMILTGQNEPSFPDRFGVELRLPISGSEFVKVLQKLDLEFSTRRDSMRQPGEFPITAPIHCDGNWGERADRQLWISAGFDKEKRRYEIYSAYVDIQGNVFYLENHFLYEPL